MGTTFSRQLMQYALTADLVDDDSFIRVKQLVTEYARKTLGIAHVRLLVRSESDGREALIPHGLAEQKHYRVATVAIDETRYTSHTALCYGTGKPLWIVAAGRKSELRCAERFKELWSEFDPEDIPGYRVPVTGEREIQDRIKTSIILPLQDSEGKLGVWNLETTEKLDITKAAMEELQDISRALTIIFRSLVNHKKNSLRSGLALNALRTTLNSAIPKLTKPRLFLASSSGARGDVIDAIKSLCNHHRFKNKLELVYWKDIRDPGNINEYLLNELSTCRYGICYFSEQIAEAAPGAESSGDGATLFRDNPNVLFEAGMLHGRSDVDSPVQAPAHWLPIREDERYSTRPPFDFASQRMLIVPREEGSLALKEDEFRTELKRHLKALTRADALGP